MYNLIGRMYYDSVLSSLYTFSLPKNENGLAVPGKMEVEIKTYLERPDFRSFSQLLHNIFITCDDTSTTASNKVKKTNSQPPDSPAHLNMHPQKHSRTPCC